MSCHFDLAYGSVAGYEHVRVGLNNQDALVAASGNGFAFGAVSDGCGSCPRSEVGAVVTTRLLAKWVPYALSGARIDAVAGRLALVRKLVVDAIDDCAKAMSDDQANGMDGFDVGWETGGLLSRQGTIADVFLATAVGFYACEEYIAVFSIGDGFYAVNGDVVRLDTEDAGNNAPAYPAYAVMPTVSDSVRRGSMDFVVRTIPAADVRTVMVATDGLRFLLGRENDNIPGRQSKVGPVSQFWEDRMFLNSHNIARKLSMLNCDVQVPDWVGQTMVTCPAVVRDDVAIVSARRVQ